MTREDQIGVAWRVGRKVGRTIYAQFGAEPSDDDELIGVMDTPELAEAVVRAHEAPDVSPRGADGMRMSGGRTVLLRWSVEVNRDDLERNDIVKPPEEWEPNDLAHADSLGLIYAWEIEVHAGADGTTRERKEPHD